MRSTVSLIILVSTPGINPDPDRGGGGGEGGFGGDAEAVGEGGDAGGGSREDGCVVGDS